MKRILMATFCVMLVQNIHAGILSSNPADVMQLIQNSSPALYLSIFFGLGLLLAFTPCVLPMVPILSGILTGQQADSGKKGFTLSLGYVLGMAITYAIAGMLAAWFGTTVQTMMQQPWIIISFSMLFILMAFWLMGWINIRIPNALQFSAKSGKKMGVWSAALMGGLSTLVVSPCVTAPLIGILSYIANSGKVLQGGLLLFVLALGMGVPLLLVGAGYGRLLPKSGPWMVRIKQLFALLMLIMAGWLLSRVWPVESPKEVASFEMIHSLPELKQRLELAFTNQQPVFVEFYAHWCSDCQAMDKHVFSQQDVQEAMAGSINLRVDISEKDANVAEIRKAYGIYGIPTMIFFNKDGKQLEQLTSVGQIDKEKTLTLLREFSNS